MSFSHGTEEGHKENNRASSAPEEINADDLLSRCQALLDELSEFDDLVTTRGLGASGETRPLRNAVAAELKSLERLSTAPSSSPRTQHTLRSSNFPFLAAVWESAKAHSNITAFTKRFFWSQAPSRRRRGQGQKQGAHTTTTSESSDPSTVANGASTSDETQTTLASDTVNPAPLSTATDADADQASITKAAYDEAKRATPQRHWGPKKRSALVDVVAEDGALWIKVSTVSESRLFFELAKTGWDGTSDSDEDDWDGGKVNGLAGPDGVPALKLDDERKAEESDDGDDRVEIVRMAEDLQRATKATRVHYKHPEVLFVLPKVHEGNNKAIDGIISDVRATGARVQCATSAPQAPAKALSQGLLELLLPSPHPPLTSTLNLDCTILLALISDLSHSRIDPDPTLHPSIQKQIQVESSQPLLPSTLYPAFAGKKLITSSASARRMREIVATIGTENEKLRADILLGEGSVADLYNDGVEGAAELKNVWAEGSLWGVQQDLMLPVVVLEESEEGEVGKRRPAWADRVEAEVGLSEVNRGTIFLGWRHGWVTVSSNRAVVKSVERVVDAWLDERERNSETSGQKAQELGSEEMGPTVWVCAVARSLVGKEVGRRD